jgi:hypothetical protein
MSPKLVDEAILASCVSHFRKVAAVIHRASQTLASPEDPPPEERDGANFKFIAKRIKALVKAEKLEGAGDLDRWAYSEVRLPQKKAADAAL